MRRLPPFRSGDPIRNIGGRLRVLPLIKGKLGKPVYTPGSEHRGHWLPSMRAPCSAMEERRSKMRTIGIDLAVKAAHKAVVADENGQFVTPVLRKA